MIEMDRVTQKQVFENEYSHGRCTVNHTWKRLCLLLLERRRPTGPGGPRRAAQNGPESWGRVPGQHSVASRPPPMSSTRPEFTHFDY